MGVFCETEDAQNGESRETGDKTKENKTKTQQKFVFDISMRKQTQITQIRHEPFYKQDMSPSTNNRW